MSEVKRRSTAMVILLVVLPLWLAVSVVGGLWLYFREDDQNESAIRYGEVISAPSIAEDLRKLVEVLGERNLSSPGARKSLAGTAAMIQGSLGPSNSGYQVRREPGPAEAPLLHFSTASRSGGAPVWVIAAYDSRPGSRGGEANASGVAATMAVARQLATEVPPRPVHFAFVPHAFDPEAPVRETVERLGSIIGKRPTPVAVLVVEAMGGGETLWLSSQEPAALPLSRAGGLGKIVEAGVAHPRDEPDLAKILHETGLPAVRVATRETVPAGEPDGRTPFAGTVAVSSRALLELIQRCASGR